MQVQLVIAAVVFGAPGRKLNLAKTGGERAAVSFSALPTVRSLGEPGLEPPDDTPPEPKARLPVHHGGAQFLGSEHLALLDSPAQIRAGLENHTSLTWNNVDEATGSKLVRIARLFFGRGYEIQIVDKEGSRYDMNAGFETGLQGTLTESYDGPELVVHDPGNSAPQIRHIEVQDLAAVTIFRLVDAVAGHSGAARSLTPDSLPF